MLCDKSSRLLNEFNAMYFNVFKCDWVFGFAISFDVSFIYYVTVAAGQHFKRHLALRLKCKLVKYFAVHKVKTVAGDRENGPKKNPFPS